MTQFPLCCSGEILPQRVLITVQSHVYPFPQQQYLFLWSNPLSCVHSLKLYCLLLHVYCISALTTLYGSRKFILLTAINLLYRFSFSIWIYNLSVQFSSVTQLCLTLCDQMDCSTPGLPAHHQLPGIVQSHVHRVSDAILSSVVPFYSQHQSFPEAGSFQMSQFFPSGGQRFGVSASVSPSNQYSGLTSFRMDCWISLQPKGLLKVFSNTTVQKHQFFGTQLSL